MSISIGSDHTVTLATRYRLIAWTLQCGAGSSEPPFVANAPEDGYSMSDPPKSLVLQKKMSYPYVAGECMQTPFGALQDLDVHCATPHCPTPRPPTALPDPIACPPTSQMQPLQPLCNGRS